jgi:hypothetical protein
LEQYNDRQRIVRTAQDQRIEARANRELLSPSEIAPLLKGVRLGGHERAILIGAADAWVAAEHRDRWRAQFLAGKTYPARGREVASDPRSHFVARRRAAHKLRELKLVELYLSFGLSARITWLGLQLMIFWGDAIRSGARIRWEHASRDVGLERELLSWWEWQAEALSKFAEEFRGFHAS